MRNLRFISLVLTAILKDFCLCQPNVLNAGNKRHAYIYCNRSSSVCCVCLSVFYLVILRNASFRFFLNPLLERMQVLLIKTLWQFLKNFLVAEKSWCKALSISRHLEISSLLLMSAENNEMLTFVSLELCFLGFVYRHNELFFSYLWSFVHEFTSSSTNPIAS